MSVIRGSDVEGGGRERENRERQRHRKACKKSEVRVREGKEP